MVKIGSANIGTNVFLAPMSGHSDLPMRLVCREAGAKFCFFEMIDSNSIVRGPRRKNSAILATADGDMPIAAQLLGSDPSIMLKAAKEILARVDIPFLDINAACPVKKAVRKRSGAYLLKDASILADIIKKLASSLPIPVTVKIRVGFDTVDIKAIVAIAEKCQASGASCLFVHGRTRAQGYAGSIDYPAIKAVKESVKIPVFGSGNVLTPQLAERMRAETGCDGILVARGALGSPWIFTGIENYSRTRTAPVEISAAARKDTLKKHLSYIEKYKDCGAGGKTGFMRKVAIWYIKGFPNASGIRRRISVARNAEEMIELIDAV